MPNQFGIEHAFPGICSLCFEEVSNFEGSHPDGRPIIVSHKPSRREMRIELDDSSKMTVTLCATCFDGFDPKDSQALMESEINGWNYEVNNSLQTRWDAKKKKDYLKEYSKRHMTGRVDKGIDTKKLKKPRKAKLKVRN